MKGWLDKYEYGGQAGYTDVPFNYNSAWGGQFQKGGKLTAEEEANFQEFFKTLPMNLRKDSPDYNIRGYWDALGRPTEFDYTQPKEDDGYYHAFSRHPETGEILKSPQHTTFKQAIEEDRKAGYFPIVTPEGTIKTVTGKQFAMGGSLPGSVGFTYARTGSIPSNGKYAKKTKASAQTGETVSQDTAAYQTLPEVVVSSTTDPEVEQARQSMFDFYSNRPANLSGDIASEAVQNVKIEEIPLKRLQKLNAYGLYFPKTNTIGYNNETITPEGYSESPYDELKTIQHEIGHSVFESLPENEQQIIEESIISPKEFRQRWPKGEISRGWSKYVTKPTEFYTRRNKMFDIFEIDESQPITDDKAQEMIDFRRFMSSVASPEEKEELLKKHPNLNKYKQNFENSPIKGEIIDFMNSIKNNVPTYKRVFNEVTAVPGEQAPIAQNGMTYYQHGLDWKPKTISKNGVGLKKFVEGGEEEPGDPPVGAAEKKFITDWNNSPMAKQMLQASVDKDDPFGRNSVFADDIRDARNNLVSRAEITILPKDQLDKVYIEGGGKEENAQGLGGFAGSEISNPIKAIGSSLLNVLTTPSLLNKIAGQDAYGNVDFYNTNTVQPKIFTQNTNDKLVSETNLHELSHASDFNGKLIPPSDIRLMDLYARGVRGAPVPGHMAKPFNNYIADPSETRARLMNLRFNANNQKLYDPFNQKATMDVLKNYKPAKGTGLYDPLWQLREIYTDAEILDMLNKVSKADPMQPRNTDMAKYGGHLENYKVPKNQNAQYKVPSFTMPRAASESTATMFFDPVTKRMVSTATTGQKKKDVAASTKDMGKARKFEKEEEKKRVAERKSAVAAKDKGQTFTLPSGETKKYEDMDVREKMYVSGKALEQRGRFNENEEAWYDDYANPLNWITEAAGALGTAPYEAREYDSNLPYVSAVVNPLFQGALGFDPLGSALKLPGKVAQSMESGLLSNAYKLNPWAEKLANPNRSYRVAGMDAARDFEATGVLRSNPTIVPANLSEGILGTRTTPFPSFQKGYADLRYLPEEGGVIFETDLPTFKRGEINPVTGNKIRGSHYAHRAIDPITGKVLTEIPSKNVRMFGSKPNWLRGYKEVPKSTPISSNISDKDKLLSIVKEKYPSWFMKESPKTKLTDISAQKESAEFLKNFLKDPSKQSLYTPVDLKIPAYGETNLGLNPHLEGGRSIRTIDEGSGLFQKKADKFEEGYNLYDILNTTQYHMRKNKEGGVIKDDMGQWAHPGEVTEIGSNQITMQGVPYPVLGVSDEGDTQMMYPGEDYEFEGKKVTEYPMAQTGYVQPSSADSARLYNNTMALLDYYGNTKKYKNLGAIPINFDITNQNMSSVNEVRDNLKKKIYPVTNRSTITELEDKDFTLSDYYRKYNNSPYKYKMRETANAILDLDSPFQEYDTRIRPTKNYNYQNVEQGNGWRANFLEGDQVTFYGYDPALIKPWIMLTDKEKALRSGKPNQSSITTVNKKSNPVPNKPQISNSKTTSSTTIQKTQPKPKYWTAKDIPSNVWKQFIKDHPGAIGMDPSHVDKNNQHMPIYPSKSEPSLKKKVSKMEPISTKKSSSPSLRMPNIPNVELPGIQMGDYEVSYYSPESKDWANRRFTSQEESDRFAQEMSQRGYPGSYGNVTQTKKTNKKSTGGWLDKYN